MYYPTATLQIGMPSLLDTRAVVLAGISLSDGCGMDGNKFRGTYKPTGNSISTNNAHGSQNLVSRDCHSFQQFGNRPFESRNVINSFNSLINSLSSINWSLGERPQTKQGRGYSRSKSIVSR